MHIYKVTNSRTGEFYLTVSSLNKTSFKGSRDLDPGSIFKKDGIVNGYIMEDGRRVPVVLKTFVNYTFNKEHLITQIKRFADKHINNQNFLGVYFQ